MKTPDVILGRSTAARLHHGLWQLGVLPMWTVCADPADYPGQFVGRVFGVGRMQGFEGSGPHAVCAVLLADTLAALRAQLPDGLTCLPRQAEDEPQIVETWL